MCQNGTEGTGRALAVIVPPAPQRAPAPRPHVPLVAQLLAARLDLPQSRARRRDAPERVASAYTDRHGRAPAGAATLLHRRA
jgi:hypothetical protein